MILRSFSSRDNQGMGWFCSGEDLRRIVMTIVPVPTWKALRQRIAIRFTVRRLVGCGYCVWMQSGEGSFERFSFY
jgi:hypothetical protein